MEAGEESAVGPAVSRKRPRGWALWWVHLIVVVLLTAGGIALVEETPDDHGVNLAIVSTALPPSVLGLPWSVLQVVFPYALEDFLFAHLPAPVAHVGLYVLADGPALVNVVIHAVVLADDGPIDEHRRSARCPTTRQPLRPPEHTRLLLEIHGARYRLGRCSSSVSRGP